jgi:hypothetical protein
MSIITPKKEIEFGNSVIATHKISISNIGNIVLDFYSDVEQTGECYLFQACFSPIEIEKLIEQQKNILAEYKKLVGSL